MILFSYESRFIAATICRNRRFDSIKYSAGAYVLRIRGDFLSVNRPPGSSASQTAQSRQQTATLKRFSDLLYQQTGIAIDERKKHLLQTKMDRLLSRKGIQSYDEYWDLINVPGNHAEFQEFIDMMTTNTTEFFRENDHFTYIQNNFELIMRNNPRIKKNREVVIWSSASSSGQEPVTLALVMLELLQSYHFQVRILATDIDSQILQKAMQGIYSAQDCSGIPNNLLRKYFRQVGDDYQTTEQVRSVISYRQFNLMNDFRFRFGFDFIFCRNVMIYFDAQTQEQLINKFYDVLVPGGLFFLGHSESMVNKKHNYVPAAPSIWMR